MAKETHLSVRIADLNIGQVRLYAAARAIPFGRAVRELIVAGLEAKTRDASSSWKRKPVVVPAAELETT